MISTHKVTKKFVALVSFFILLFTQVDLRKPIFAETLADIDSKQEQLEYWVDSIDGDDFNNGLSEANPKQTIAAFDFNSNSNNVTLYVRSGSEFREQLTLGDNCQVLRYSDGVNPIFNAADIATNSNFSSSGGQANVYEILWTFDDSLCDVVQVVEDDVPLKWAGSISNCEKTPGSFYNSNQTSPATIYVHASDSSSITSNGKVYEIAKRAHGVKLGDNCYARNICTKTNANNDGSLVVGTDFKADGLLIQFGTKHCMFAKEGLCLKDVIFDHCNNKNSLQKAGHLVVYNRILREEPVVLDNVKFENRKSVSTASYSLIAHNAFSGSLSYVHIKNSEFKHLGFAFAFLDVSQHVKIENSDFVECGGIHGFQFDISPWHFEECRFYMSDQETLIGGSYIGGSNGASNAKLTMRRCFFNVNATRLFYGGWKLFDIQYCSFFASKGIKSDHLEFSFFDGFGWKLISESSGSFIFKRNIVSGWEQPWRVRPTSFDNWGTLDIDYNYYIIQDNKTGKYDFITSNGTLARWRANTGQDANSVEVTENASTFILSLEAADVQIDDMLIIAGIPIHYNRSESQAQDDFEILSPEALLGYRDWIAAYGLSEESALPLETPDGGTLNNLLEFFFGGNPAINDDDQFSPSLFLDESADSVGIRFSKATDLLNYRIECSIDLENWFDASLLKGFSEIYVDLGATGIELYDATISLNKDKSKFLRLTIIE